MKIAILGVGEVGSTLARDLLASGVVVSGWDPAPCHIPDGLVFASDNPHAAADADLILSANLAAVAVDVAREVVPTLNDGQVYADMNTAAPEIKRQIDRFFDKSPALFADVAIMSPILPHGLKTPTLVCGAGADTFSSLLSPLGMPVTVLHEPAGQAATRKLLRSIVYKGIAAVIMEALEAAQKLDMEPWIRGQMMTILQDEAMIDRFVEGSRKHAARRIHEMDAVRGLLEELGVESYSSTAAKQRLVDLLEEAESE